MTNVNAKSKSKSTQVSRNLVRETIWRGRRPNSFVIKLGQRFLGVRELPLRGTRTLGTQTGNEMLLATSSNPNTRNIEAANQVPTDSTTTPESSVNITVSNQYRRRMQWRDSKRRCRNWILNSKGEVLSVEEKTRQVEQSRISNAAARQKRTEMDWIEVRRKH